MGPNYVLYHHVIEAFTSVIDGLLLLAQQEAWDDLLLAWPNYQAAATDFPQIDWLSCSAAEQQLLEAQLLQLERVNTHLMNLTMDWRTELHEILQNTVQSRKLNVHYR